MAKAAVALLTAAAGLLVGSAKECDDFAGEYYSAGGPDELELYRVDQDGCTTVTHNLKEGKSYEGEADSSGLYLIYEGMRFNGTRVGNQLMWTFGRTWTKDCIGIPSATYITPHGRVEVMMDPAESCAISVMVDGESYEGSVMANYTVFDGDSGFGSGVVDAMMNIHWESREVWRPFVTTPCFEFEDFNPRAIMHGHCEGDEDVQDPKVCTGMGCRWEDDTDSDDRCHCEEAQCRKNDFSWKLETCASLMFWWDKEWLNFDPQEVYTHRSRNGTRFTGAAEKCNGTDWQHEVNWVARRCCHGKTSFCMPEGRGLKCQHTFTLNFANYTQARKKGFAPRICGARED